MKNTNNPKSITCRIVNTGILMHINTIDEISFPGYFKIDACNVTAADGLPDGIDGTCLSAYLEVSDTNHNTDNLNRAAIGQTLFYTNALGINAAYYRSGINKNGMVEWSTWVDLGAATTTDIQDHTITAQKLSSDVLTKIQESANGAWWSSGPNAVTLNINKNDGTVGWQTLPAATTEKAGVMTSQDRKTIDGIDAAIAEGEKRALRRLFIAAGAEYNDSGADKTKTAPWGETVTHKAGYYYLNGLGDITEEQMMAIYNEKDALKNIYRNRGNQYFKSRTLLIPTTSQTNIQEYYIKGDSLNFTWANCASLEILKFANVLLNTVLPSNMITTGGNLRYTFYQDSNLRIVYPINVSSVTSIASNTFEGCTSLTELRLFGLKVNLPIGDSSIISKESVLYIVNNSAPSTAITITLHPDAYARLADEVDIVAALEAQPLVSLVSA